MYLCSLNIRTKYEINPYGKLFKGINVREWLSSNYKEVPKGNTFNCII